MNTQIMMIDSNSGLAAVDTLLSFSGYWSRSWKEHVYQAPTLGCRSMYRKHVAQASVLLCPQSGLPNRQFLNLLLETCFCKDCATVFPFSLTRLEIRNYERIANSFSRLDIDKNIDFIVGCLNRRIDTSCDVLIRGSSSSFYIVSFNVSVSRITWIVDDIHKSLMGLTIPYPKGKNYVDVELDAGIALFKHINAVSDWEKWIELAKLSCFCSQKIKKTHITVYE